MTGILQVLRLRRRHWLIRDPSGSSRCACAAAWGYGGLRSSVRDFFESEFRDYVVV